MACKGAKGSWRIWGIIAIVLVVCCCMALVCQYLYFKKKIASTTPVDGVPMGTAVPQATEMSSQSIRKQADLA